MFFFNFFFSFIVNEKKVIIVVGEIIKLVDNKKANSEIGWELIKNYDYMCWFIFKMNLYDEINDEFLFLKAILVLFDFLFLCIILIIF